MKFKNIIDIWLSRLLLCVSISLIISGNGWAQPTATISGTTTVCQDAPQPNITFFGANGIAPYTFTYTINSGTFQSVTTTSGNSVTVSVPTGTPDTFTYALISVSDATLVSNAQSGSADVTVNPTLTVSVSIVASATTICSGTSVTFTATPTNGGTIPAYQWKVNGVNAGSDSPVFTSTTLANNDVIEVVLTSNAPCNSGSATSNAVTMTVNPILPVSVSISPSANNICTGTSVTFTATPTNGGTAPVFQWRVNGLIVGSTSTHIYTPLNGDVVTCQLTSNELCTTGNPAISSPITMNVTTPVTPGVSITAAPSGAICAGTSVTFTATPTDGGTPSYQWKINGVNAGTNNPNFTSASLSNNDAVSVTMTSSITCVTSPTAISNTITMAVNPLPLPTLSSSAAGNSFCQGTSVTFTASGGTNYDFMVGGVSEQNGTSATYTTTSLPSGTVVVSVIVTNASGCSALSTGITNTVHPLPIATLTSSDADNVICQGTIVTFTASGGTNYNFMTGTTSLQNGTSATYTTTSTTPLTNGQEIHVVVTNSTGCIATSPSITTTVNPIPIPVLTSSDADNIFCAGTSVIFTATGGSNYNFRIGGVTVQNGTSATYTTSSLTNGQIVDVVVTNSGGCIAISTGITNTVIQNTVANAGTGGSVCGLIFKLSAVPSTGTGTWTKTTGPGTASFTPNNNTAAATVTVSEFGTYTFTWTESNGICSSSSVVTVTFNLQPVANAGIGGSNCGLAFNLNGTMNAGTGTWAKVSGPGNVTFSPNPDTPNALVTVTTFGSYSFSWTVTNGTCSNSANVNVVFIQEISADGGAGGSICGKVFNLNAMVPANGIGTWSKSNGPGNAVFKPDIHQPVATVTVDQAGAYAFGWTVTTGTCSSTDIILVTFHANPLINAGRDTAVCKGGSVQLEAVGVGTVSWTPVQLLSNPGIINPIATPDTTTKFIVNLTDQFGCKNSDTLKVEVRNKVVADAGPDQEINDLFSTQLDAKLAHSYENGIWSVFSGTGQFTKSSDPRTVVSGLTLGINKLIWTVTNGVCPSSSDSTNIIVKILVIPTMITPNMDGRNDYFIIGGLTDQAKTELIIFDRRGVEVYKNSSYDNSWNGVDYNNNPLPDDTYFYLLKYSNGKSYKGYIVIRR